MAIHETAHIVAAAVQKRILVSVRITALGLNAVIKKNMMLMQIVFNKHQRPCANILMFLFVL